MDMASNGPEIKNVSFREIVNMPSTTYATFGIYRYPAKFIPQVISYIFDKYSQPGMSVFDPFAGSGTVGIVAKLHGNSYELWDLNPMLKTLHAVATMEPVENINLGQIWSKMVSSKERFIPDWSNLEYWYPKEFLPFLYKVWGYYHSLREGPNKLLLTIPLLKISRYFSYDDSQRQKLSRSERSQSKIKNLESSDWKLKFKQMFEKEANKITKALLEYKALSPKNTKSTILGGVDSFTEKLKQKHDLLITSPPYLQSQEYLRQAKLDLFWLGYKEQKIKDLSRFEMPYRKTKPYEILSKTYSECRNKIKEDHIRSVYDRYFWGVLNTFTRLQGDISKYMFIFVGRASVRGQSIPLDTIFIEHLTHFGWKHEATLIDRIVSRRLFSYKVNPATNMGDARTKTENLVILRKT